MRTTIASDNLRRQVIETEAAARAQHGGRRSMGDDLNARCGLIVDCPASVLCDAASARPGTLRRKLSATFSSTGTPSHFLSPADAVHGDLGSIRKGDVVLIFSASGESDEILAAAEHREKAGSSGHRDHGERRTTASGRIADVVLEMGKIEEACPLGLAPSRLDDGDARAGRCAGADGDEAAEIHAPKISRCFIRPGSSGGS